MHRGVTAASSSNIVETWRVGLDIQSQPFGVARERARKAKQELQRRTAGTSNVARRGSQFGGGGGGGQRERERPVSGILATPIGIGRSSQQQQLVARVEAEKPERDGRETIEALPHTRISHVRT